MRIAMIGSRGVPAGMGGVERVVEELARELAAVGHQVTVYGRAHYLAEAPPVDLPPGVECVLSPGLPARQLDALTHTASALQAAARRPFDVIHLHSPGPGLLACLPEVLSGPLVLRSVPLRRVVRRPALVFTVHAPDWNRRRWSRLARATLRAGLRAGMRYADAVTAVCEPLATELAERFGRAVEVTPNAVRPPSDSCSGRTGTPRHEREWQGAPEQRRSPPVGPPSGLLGRWGLPPGGYALHVGRLVPEKRLDLLLEAWRHLDACPRAPGLSACIGRSGGQGPPPLLVAGGFAERGFRRHCLRRATGLNVRFIGPVFGADLSALYAHAALVVQPSELEGMSLVLLEAAVHGRCVVAADTPASRAALGDSAVYSSCADAAALAGAVRRCLDDPALRAELGRRACRRVRAFTWADAARRMLAVYRAAVERRDARLRASGLPAVRQGEQAPRRPPTAAGRRVERGEPR